MYERRDSENVDNVPALHMRATSTSSTVHLSTPRVSGSTPLPPQVDDGRRRSSIWGLSAFIKRPQSSETSTSKHRRSSSFTKLRHMLAGGRRRSTEQNEEMESKSPFTRFIFPRTKEGRDSPRGKQWASPSASTHEDSLSPRRRNRASGDWRDLVTSAKGSLSRLTSSSTPDLLSLGRSKSPDARRELSCPQPPAWRRSAASNDAHQRFQAIEARNFVQESPRTNLRPVSYSSELFTAPQRLSRLTEIEEDERSNLDVTSIVDASPLIVPVPECEGDFKLPLDLGSNFNVDSFALSEYSNVRVAKIGRVSQTSYFQPAVLRREDMSPGVVDLEITFPMPPRPRSPVKLATHRKSFDELSLSAVNGGQPKCESEAGESAVGRRSHTLKPEPCPTQTSCPSKVARLTSVSPLLATGVGDPPAAVPHLKANT